MKKIFYMIHKQMKQKKQYELFHFLALKVNWMEKDLSEHLI